MYGWRGRIGLLVPAGNTVMEPEVQRMIPDGVSSHAARVPLKDVTPESLGHMAGDAAAAAERVADGRMGVIAFGCTSGSFVGGPGYDQTIIDSIVEATGVQATTTTTAVIRAFERFGVRRIALATPYTDEVTELEARTFEALGYEVVAWASGGITGVADIQDCPPEISYRRARDVDRPEADAVFISCTGLRTIENLAKLEADLGKPVISSNQATVAEALRLLGVHDVRPGFGSLFERTFASPDPAIAPAPIIAVG